MFQFQNEEYLWFLLLIPFLIIAYNVLYWWKTKQLKKFGDLELIHTLSKDISKRGKIWKFIFILLAISSLVICIARPQFGTKYQEITREGIEIIIAVDVSNSMLTKDIAPNRLDKAKKSIARLISKLREDKIGLIVFAGDAYVQLPVTSDYASAKMFLSSIGPSIVPKQGTAIGSAIDLAVRSFNFNSETNKVLVIITDGENHEDDPVEAAEIANKEGIIIHTIGMGLPKGKPIPNTNGGGFMKDKSGNVVMSKLDEKTLRKIAAAGKGTYVRATNSNSGLDLIISEINKVEKTKSKQKEYAEYDENFIVFAWIALILLVLEILIFERKIFINLFK